MSVFFLIDLSSNRTSFMPGSSSLPGLLQITGKWPNEVAEKVTIAEMDPKLASSSSNTCLLPYFSAASSCYEESPRWLIHSSSTKMHHQDRQMLHKNAPRHPRRRRRRSPHIHVQNPRQLPQLARGFQRDRVRVSARDSVLGPHGLIRDFQKTIRIVLRQSVAAENLDTVNKRWGMKFDCGVLGLCEPRKGKMPCRFIDRKI
jgi:hypothetical protein